MTSARGAGGDETPSSAPYDAEEGVSPAIIAGGDA